jgi:branched-chain amino acid transport system substrate-binding protein
VIRPVNSAVLAYLASACFHETPAPIRIAVAFPSRNAAVAFMAADEINAAGGVQGAFVQIIRDTIPIEAEPADVEVRRAESIVAQRPLVGVVGHGGSRGSLVAAPVYNEAHVVHLVPTGTSRLLRNAGRWTFALPADDSAEGAFIARFARERLGARRAALFYINDEYGVGLRDGVRSALGTLALAREVRLSLESDLEPAVDLALRDRPDVVIVAARFQTATAVARMLAARDSRVPIVAGDGAVTLPELAEGVGAWGEGRVYAATFWLPSATDSASRRFAAALRRRLLRQATASDALIYDAVRLLVAAVAAVGREPEAVRGYVASLGAARPAFPGVSGPIGFGRERAPLVMGVVRGGDLVSVEPRF